jgi:geranylgeranyl reductase family protein
MRTVRPNCFDVAVVGAGPAGCCAARALAQKGHSVVLLEKASLPRYKTCGGGVLARAFKFLPPHAAGIVERSFPSVALQFQNGNMSFIARRPQPLVYMTMRADLDCWLARQAQQAGVQLVESCAVKGLNVQADGVELISETDRYRARFAIAADGVHSTAAKSAGWADPPALAPALEYEIFPADGDFARFSDMARFDFGLIDAGYAWVFPKRNHLSVGILSTRRICRNLEAKLADYLRWIGLTRIQKTERHGYLIPLAPRRGPLARGRVLLVGDAAGLADPVTAEGITYAIVSGQLAANAITEGGLDSARVSSIYQSLLEKNILGELRAGRFLARILYHYPRIRKAVFRLNGQRLCEFVTDVITGDASYLDAMKRPANYLKLLNPWPPGARR